MINPKNIIYTALFVDDPKKLLELFVPKHVDVYAHHSTNWYEPKDVSDLEVGKSSQLKIIGRAWDEKGDTLLVENPKSKNKYPHITLSCANGVPPVYSNELLEKAHDKGTIEVFEKPVFVAVTEGYELRPH